MAQSLFQDLPQAQGYWNVNLSKAAVLFGQLLQGGTITIPASVPGNGSQPAPAGFSRVYTYYGATNNIHTITYQQDAVVQGKVTFTYIAGGVADDDDIATEVWSDS